MNAAFDFHLKTRLVFGCGSLRRLPELAHEIGGRRALLVTDRGIVMTGHVRQAVELLQSAGIHVTTFDDVRENPTTLDIDRCTDVARAGKIDFFVGLGGGSSLDTAKGCNFLLTNGGEMKDYWGVGKAKQPMLPFLAIPTTAGTGSECQSAALIADEKTHQKMACLDPKAAARVAILDPELTVSQPGRVTAVTGVDALTHALESAVTKTWTPVSRLFSREAFSMCLRALPKVLANPKDLDSRGEMMLGAAFAGIAIENSMLGAAHAAANPLTARFGVVHGSAVGLMLPHVIRYNGEGSQDARDEYARLAEFAELPRCYELGTDRAWVSLVFAVEALLERAAIPRSLAEAGVALSEIRSLASEASKQWTATFNPRAVSEDDFRRLYEAAAVPRS